MAATFEDIRRFQLHLAESGVSICTRNITMTGLRFLFRVTLRRLDLAAEMYHLRAPQKIPQVMSTDEAKRLLAVADTLKVRHPCYGTSRAASGTDKSVNSPCNSANPPGRSACGRA
jgi:site-specific recombinase XerD